MNKYLISAIVASLFIFIGGCREIFVTTTVKNDGSFTQMITIKGDSSHVLDKDLPYPVDESWKFRMIKMNEIHKLSALDPILKVVKDTTDPKHFIVEYTKDFESDAAFNDEIRNDTGWRKALDRKVTIDKRFGFFFSYISYTEVCPPANPFTRLDINDYLATSELNILSGKQVLLTKRDSSYFEEIEEKATVYLLESITLEIVETLRSGVQQADITELESFPFDQYTDSIAAKIEDMDFESLCLFIDAFADWTGNSSFLEMKAIDPPLFDALDQKWYFLFQVVAMDGYKLNVIMPGLLTQTNSAEILGNLVSWYVDGNPVIYTGYSFFAESRIVNYWAFLLSGLLLLALVVLISVKVFRR